MRQYLTQNPNKAVKRWIGVFTDFYRDNERLPDEREMSLRPNTIEREIALGIVKERILDGRLKPKQKIIIGLNGNFGIDVTKQ